MIALLIGLAAAAIFVTVFFAVISYPAIMEWFHNPNIEALATSSADEVAYTLKERLSTGAYEVVQGVFNQRTNVAHKHAMRKLGGSEIDAGLRAAHGNKSLAVYR